MNIYKKKYTPQLGLTLVEIAVVLVVVGLIIGGVLRGQELLESARVRNLIDQKSSIQTALLGFTNRYKLMPGDLNAAQAQFIGPNISASTSGAGNGEVLLTAAAATNESPLFFQNLSATQFLSCASCNAAGNAISSAQNSPINALGGVLQFGSAASGLLGNSWLDRNASPARNILTTGALISSVTMREIDLKADDAAPHLGFFRQSTMGGAAGTATCAPPPVPAVAGVPNRWAVPVSPNCAGAWLF